MEQIFLQILSQNGVIVFLFVATFAYFLLRGLPYTVKEFFSLFREMIDIQRDFNEEVKKMSSSFMAQLENSNRWHDAHDRKLEEIHADVKEIKMRK